MTPDLASYFTFEPAPRSLDGLETPIPVVDLDIVERNIARWQARCDELKLANRPHIKTHKLVPLAKAQIAAGAKGITVQKLGEAEVMADGGIADLLLTFNVVGRAKLARLAALARRTDIAVTVDSAEVAEGIASAADQAGRPIRVLVECDTGMGRCGVQTPEAALALAQTIARIKGLSFGGLMTYPKAGAREATAAFLGKARNLLERAGLPVETISSGGTPDMWSSTGLDGVTEYRAGTYIYQDRMQIAADAANEADCALTVLTTVVSRPTAARAILDAGSKTLTSDRSPLPGHGHVRGEPDITVSALSEEHGFLDVAVRPAGFRVGDRLHLIPNHVCPVSNLFDQVAMVRGELVLGFARVDARGRVT